MRSLARARLLLGVGLWSWYGSPRINNGNYAPLPHAVLNCGCMASCPRSASESEPPHGTPVGGGGWNEALSLCSLMCLCASLHLSSQCESPSELLHLSSQCKTPSGALLSLSHPYTSDLMCSLCASESVGPNVPLTCIILLQYIPFCTSMPLPLTSLSTPSYMRFSRMSLCHLSLSFGAHPPVVPPVRCGLWRVCGGPLQPPILKLYLYLTRMPYHRPLDPMARSGSPLLGQGTPWGPLPAPGTATPP